MLYHPRFSFVGTEKCALQLCLNKIIRSQFPNNLLQKVQTQMYQQDYDYDEFNKMEEKYYQDNSQEDQTYQNSDYYSRLYEEEHEEKKDFQILPLAKIQSELSNAIEETMQMVFMGKGWSLLLLKLFKWNKDYMKEEFYNNSEMYLKRIGFRKDLKDPCHFLNGEKGVCQVCYYSNIPIYSNICGHSFCMDCWIGHLKASFQSGSIFLSCMNFDCKCPLLVETIKGMLLLYGEEGMNLQKKLKKKILEEFISKNKEYQFCTGVNCDNCIKLNTKIDSVKCTCGKAFCFKCQSDDHYPLKCQQMDSWMMQIKDEQANARWISQNTKLCPGCRKPVERSMGCNYMFCRCGKNFCYMCQRPWHPDHDDHFKCHIFKKESNQNLKRYSYHIEQLGHSSQRYLFNKEAADTYRKVDVFDKRKLLFKVLNIELIQTQFIQNAYQFAIQCCQKLKWIYAFSYFDELKYHKQIFQFSLGEYQRFKENLLKLLAVDLARFLIEIQVKQYEGQMQRSADNLREQFKGLKNQIVNYYTCTKKFKEKFMVELKLIMQQTAEIDRMQ